jgi:lipopolysaccharide biosynthesis glycosyltransferase
MINIVIAFSPNWSKYVLIEMYAIFKNNSSPITIYLLTDELDKQNIIEFDNVCDFFGEGYTYQYVDCRDAYARLIPSEINVEHRFSKYTLYRLLIPHLVNEDKILYLDADTLVTDDILEMYHAELSDNLLAGVIDIGSNPYKPAIKFAQEDDYFNAGVTLMNLREIRRLNIHEQWTNEANTKLYTLHDQDIMNITCKHKYVSLPLIYNVSLSTGLDIEEADAKIIHYAGIKPWDSEETIFYNVWEKSNANFNYDWNNIKIK